jgi:hypothetical protein
MENFRGEEMYTENEVLEEIKDFVRDHYESFGAYPMEVEISDGILTWDQYWAILDASG